MLRKVILPLSLLIVIAVTSGMISSSQSIGLIDTQSQVIAEKTEVETAPTSETPTAQSEEKIEQLKNEINNRLPNIRFKKGELGQKIPEIRAALSDTLKKYGVSEAVQFERKSNNLVELKLNNNKLNRPGRISGREQESQSADRTVMLSGIVEDCPCDPGGHPDDCCCRAK